MSIELMNLTERCLVLCNTCALGGWVLLPDREAAITARPILWYLSGKYVWGQ